MLVEIKNLKKHFEISSTQKLHAVDGVSLSIGEKEIIGLVGESGSGKSTLGKAVVGLHEKTEGTVAFDGQELPASYNSDDFRRFGPDMQMIFQDPYSSLNPRMTIEEILCEPLRLQGKVPKNQWRDMAADWMRKVNLHPDQLGRYPHEFSGGQRQRIGIARALITRPKFVVCDEPISALDVSVQAQVINLLAELQQSMGLTLLFIAHDLSMVRYISDRMIVMYLGAIVEQGPADKVFFEPQHPYTQLLTASNPIADPAIEKKREHQLIEGDVPSPVNLPPGCRFAGRCPKVMDICLQKEPQLKEVSPEVLVSCHLFE